MCHPAGAPKALHMLGRSESALRQGFCLRQKRLYGAKRRPTLWGPEGKKKMLSFSYSSSFNTAMNASVGSCTVPKFRIFFLPAPPDVPSGGGPKSIAHARAE